MTPAQERMLQECLQALDSGATVDDCLSRYPEDATTLRPQLELRAALLFLPTAEPPAGAFERGRSQLLERVAVSQAGIRTRTPFLSALTALVRGEDRMRSTFARAAASVVAVAVLAGGALGVSAAGGFGPARSALEPARDVLSALRIISDEDDGGGRDSDERPSDREPETPAVADRTPELERVTETAAACARDTDRGCEATPRPTPTPTADARPTKAPVRDAAPTATRVIDEPLEPTDRPTATEEPVRDIVPGGPEPTSPPRDTTPTELPREAIPTDTRDDVVATPEPTDAVAETPVADQPDDPRTPEPTPQPPTEPPLDSDPRAPDLPDAGPIDVTETGAIDGFEEPSDDIR